MITRCRRCRLSESRGRIVNGEGIARAKIAIVGEAPGAQEDELGRPFVGRSGKFLNEVIEREGTRREEVFITNVVRCRPPGNRQPKNDEIEACRDYLIRELKKVRPRVIVALGTVAVAAFIRSPIKLRDIVGNVMTVDIDGFSTIVIPNYHPAAAMRNRNMRLDFEKTIAKALSMVR